jgi:hypothetical protein
MNDKIKKKRIYDDKYREYHRKNHHAWINKGYCKINVWCPIEIREEIKNIIKEKTLMILELRKGKLRNEKRKA